MLAAGHVLFCSENRHRGEFSQLGGKLSWQRQAEHYELEMPRLHCHPQPLPDWAGTMFGRPPEIAAHAGDDTGYLILAWARGSNLADLSPPGEQLAKHTRRAVIATCATSASSQLAAENIHYRYFAPQYGVPEDAATGSAMRILADFWSQHNLPARLSAVQRSAAGGLLHARLQPHTVSIAGQVVATEAGGGVQ